MSEHPEQSARAESAGRAELSERPAKTGPSDADRPSTATLTLLRAVQEIGTTDDPNQLLRKGLRLACRVTDASAGVLGLLDETRTDLVTHVLTEGWDEEDDQLAARLLSESVRTDSLAADVVVAGRRVAVIHLDRSPGPSAARDRMSVQTVAEAIGVRLETLRQREISQLHTRVTQTLWDVDQTLTEGVDLDVTLPLLVDRTRTLSGAETVALVAEGQDGQQRVLAAAGDLPGTQLADLRTDVTDALRSDAARHWWASTPAPGSGKHSLRQTRTRTSILPLPLDRRTEKPVVLVVHRWTAPAGVPHHEVQDVLSALALHASLVLARDVGEREHDLLTLLEDRDRIARDLHDLVIQRLFAIGLTLQGASRRTTSPEVVERLEGAVSELDLTIRDIRATIFELRHRPGEGSFRADLRTLVDSYTPTLGFAPVVHLRGPLDSVADDEVHTQVLMVVREALSNVARHAHATAVEVTAEATATELGITVVDNGVGLREEVVESGLANVRGRAADRGGHVLLSHVLPHGTRLRWTVPI